MAMHAGDHKFSLLAGLLAMITCSMAITLAAREPPPGLNKNAYLITLAGAFFAGVAAIVATARVSDNPRTTRRAAGRKLVLASLGPLAVVGGLSAASLL